MELSSIEDQAATDRVSNWDPTLNPPYDTSGSARSRIRGSAAVEVSHNCISTFDLDFWNLTLTSDLDLKSHTYAKGQS